MPACLKARIYERVDHYPDRRRQPEQTSERRAVYTKYVDGAEPLDNDREVAALVATMLPVAPSPEDRARFIALLSTSGKLSRRSVPTPKMNSRA